MWESFNYANTRSTHEYFLIRPCGKNRFGEHYTPSVVRQNEKGALVDSGGIIVRLEHHKKLEWTRIPE